MKKYVLQILPEFVSYNLIKVLTLIQTLLNYILKLFEQKILNGYFN